MSVNSFTATSLFLLVGAMTTALPVWGQPAQHERGDSRHRL